MTRHKKLQILLFMGVALVAMILLSAGISELELRPGQPFSLGRRLPPQRWMGESLGGGDTLMTLFRAFLALSLLLFPVSVVYLIISPEARKEFFARLSFFLLLLAIFYLMMRGRSGLPEEQAQRGGTSPEPLPAFPPPAEFTPNPPQWLTLVTALGLAVLVAAVLVGVLRFIWRRRQPPASPLAQLAQEVQDALDALLAGANVKNTVMHCYHEMARVLNEQRGIRRQRDMTPREFEHRLEDAGLPSGPVQRLTRLFEEVRYGTKDPSEHEEQQAIACLTAIVEACRSST